MTFEELKAKAERQGYKLVKPRKDEKLLPCPKCGSKRIRQGGDFIDGKLYYCLDCRLKSEPHKFLYQAKYNWNKLVEELCKEKSL